MKIPKEVKEILTNEKFHQLATSTKDGIPNVSTFGAMFLLDDETIVIIDNYMKKTAKNVQSNPNVSILVRKDRESYQIKGTCKYMNSGPEYEKGRKWAKARGEHYPAKGILIIHFDSFYNSMTGPKAGKELT